MVSLFKLSVPVDREAGAYFSEFVCKETRQFRLLVGDYYIGGRLILHFGFVYLYKAGSSKGEGVFAMEVREIL